jgi:hypothetical protein
MSFHAVLVAAPLWYAGDLSRDAPPGTPGWRYGVWRTMRFDDGSWMPYYDLVQSYVQMKRGPDYLLAVGDSDGPWGYATGITAVSCAVVGGEFHVVGVVPPQGVTSGIWSQYIGALWHTVQESSDWFGRRLWQESFNLIEDEESKENQEGHRVGGRLDRFSAVSCAAVGDELHVVGVVNQGAPVASHGLWHTMRYPGGTWQPFFGQLRDPFPIFHPSDPVGSPPPPPGSPPTGADLLRPGLPDGAYPTVGCAGIGDELHVVYVGKGQLRHTIRHRDGTWQWPWEGIDSYQNDHPGLYFTNVSCAAVGDELHVVGLSEGGGVRMWHTIRYSDGTWQRLLGDVDSQNPGVVKYGVGDALHPDWVWVPLYFTNVSCAGVGDELHLVGLATVPSALDHTPKVWHTIRYADGTWQGQWLGTGSYLPDWDRIHIPGSDESAADYGYADYRYIDFEANAFSDAFAVVSCCTAGGDGTGIWL